MSTMKNEESIEGKREGKHLHEKLLSPGLFCATHFAC